MSLEIGFFIPEFPGQTHIFLWRERQALEQLGIHTTLVSTTAPPNAISSHSWAKEAYRSTDYLLPFTLSDAWNALSELLRCGPRRWYEVVKLVARSTDYSPLMRLRLLAMLLPAAKLAHIARLRGWSHVHVHSCGDAANVAMLCSVVSGVSYSLTLHGPDLEDYGPNQRQKWRNCSFATVISRRLYDVAVTQLGLIDAQKVRIAPMGVDLDQIRRTQDYAIWTSGSTCRLFSCGRLNKVKGHDDLLRTVSLLRDRGLIVQLRIAGEDEQGGSGYRREFEEAIDAVNLRDHVSLLGAISEEQVRQELQSAHIFVLASHNEGISVAIMEAMAMEVPVVVTNVGGNAELVQHDCNGLLVPDGRPDNMAEEIVRVLADPDLAHRLRLNARARVEAHFNHHISAAALSTLLRSHVEIAARDQDSTSKWVDQSPQSGPAIGVDV